MCDHIKKFYISTVKTPILYCEFSSENFTSFKKFNNITQRIDFEQSVSDHGDTCHFDIFNLTDKEGEKFTNFQVNPTNVKICDFDATNFSEEEMSDFLADARSKFNN